MRYNIQFECLYYCCTAIITDTVVFLSYASKQLHCAWRVDGRFTCILKVEGLKHKWNCSIALVVVFICSWIMNRKRIPLSRADIIIQNAAIKLCTQPVVGKRVAPCSDSPEKENQNDGHCRRSTRRRRVSRQLLFDSVIMNTFGLFTCLHTPCPDKKVPLIF